MGSKVIVLHPAFYVHGQLIPSHIREEFLQTNRRHIVVPTRLNRGFSGRWNCTI